MSLFVAGPAAGPAFEYGNGTYWAADKLGILIGSLAAAAAGYAVLSASLPRNGKRFDDSVDPGLGKYDTRRRRPQEPRESAHTHGGTQK